MVKQNQWREIQITPLEEGQRIWLKPNFEQRLKKSFCKNRGVTRVKQFYLRMPENSSWNLIKSFFDGRLDFLFYRRADCNRGSLQYCHAVRAIKGDDSTMGHLVSMVFAESVATMSEPNQKIWLHDVPTIRKFPYEVVRTERRGWRLKDNSNENAKLLYNSHYLMMIVRSDLQTDIYFYRTPCLNG